MGMINNIRQILSADNSEAQLRVYFIGLQGLLALLFITPFAIMRFLNAEILKGLIDLAIVVGMLALSFYVVYGPGKRFASQLAYFFSSIYIVGANVVVYFSDIYTVMWMFPAAISCYFVLNAKHAIVYTLLAIFVFFILNFNKFTNVQLIIVIATYIATCGLTFVLSVQIVHDRKAIQNYAFYDVLTGAKTRNLLIKELQEAIEQKISPLSIIVFDIDHFKNINDTKGHSIGDYTLKQVVKTVNARLTTEQNIYRYGGEEFFILLNLNAHHSLELAEKIRSAVEKSEGIAGIKITISLGVAEHKENENLENLTKRADKALYASKEGGRNRSTLAV